MNRFVVNAKLPSLNEVININRKNKFMGAKFKREVEEVIGWSIKNALASNDIKKYDSPVELTINFYEKTKRRDVDNIIAGGTKFLLDTMTKLEIIKDDNRKYVKQVHCNVYDSNRDYVEVYIYDTGILRLEEERK